ncbi:MAG: hypothetical protein LBR86_08375 [Tannerella sp.]|jgi:hypothetical protein|nr:hypothetical protein [Tannerella sp.]
MIGVVLSGCLLGYAQEACVERSVWGIQGDLLSVWGYNESRLSDVVALRCEAGLRGNFFYSYSNIFGGYSRYAIIPELSVEPRWYYNLAWRQAKDRPTAHNSANYFSLKTTFYPEWLVVGDAHILPANMLTVIPMWGIRRHYGTHFSLEAGAGAGYQHIFGQMNAWRRDKFVIGWHCRIGYTF